MADTKRAKDMAIRDIWKARKRITPLVNKPPLSQSSIHGIAAVLGNKIPRQEGSLAVIITGQNVDINILSKLLQEYNGKPNG